MLTSIVSALVAEPFGGGVTGFGTKVQVTPAGWPLHANVTALLNPPVEVIVVVLEPLPPGGGRQGRRVEADTEVGGWRRG